MTELDSGIAIGNVKLFQNNQRIKADRVEYFKDPKSKAVSYKAIGNVEIIDSIRTAICGLASYSAKNEETVLKQKPKIISENRVINGDLIRLNYANNLLKRVFIPNNANVSSASIGYSQMKIDSSRIYQASLIL